MPTIMPVSSSSLFFEPPPPPPVAVVQSTVSPQAAVHSHDATASNSDSHASS